MFFKNRKKGAVATYFVVIGILIAVVVAVAYGRAISAFLGGEDKSLKRFGELAHHQPCHRYFPW